MIRGTQRGTSTNEKGAFSIDANRGEVLEFSRIGYKKVSITVSANVNLRVTMEVEATSGNEVIVVGYGTQKRKNLTSSQASVKAADIQNISNANIASLLQGRASGVQITQNNGTPGAAATVHIRGISSLRAGNDPLYVVDEVPIVGNLSDINPNDIESIDILKDAAAVVIYGARAANGVILITTKRGKGRTKITLNASYGVQNISKKLDVLEGAEGLQLMKEMYDNSGMARDAFFTQIDTTVNTNWTDLILRNNAPIRTIDLGIAGSMVDFGDEVPEDAVLYDGRKGTEMHNFYAYDYHRTFAQAFSERRNSDFILFGRAASAGSQRWVASFAGDHRANFTGLRAALTGALNLASCGFSIWSSDMGGFFGQPDPVVYIRWLELSTFTPLMRTHGTEPREPWHYGDEAVKLYKHYAAVREGLANYLLQQAELSHQTGLPMMRSMLVAFPNQPGLAAIDNQYLLGTDVLVAPVLHEGNTRPVTFPKGRWTNFWTGELLEGGTTQEIDAPQGRIPVYLRAGTTLTTFNFKQ